VILGYLSGSIFCCKNKIFEVSGNFNTSNNISDKRQLYMAAPWETFQTPKFFQPTIFLEPQSLGKLAPPERPMLLAGARVALYLISSENNFTVQKWK